MSVRSLRRQGLRRAGLLLRYRPRNVPEAPVFVLATARTGSTLLVGHLNRFPDVRFLGEVLHPSARGGIRPGAGRGASLRHIRHNLASIDGRVRGAKLILGQLAAHHVGVEDLRAEYPGVRFVVLWRRSVADQFVSMRLAQASGVWHARGSAAGTPTAPVIDVDPADFARHYDRVARQYRSVLDRAWVRERSLLVSYEAMVGDPQRLVDELLSPWLGMPAPTADADLVKLNRRPLDAVVRNYDEVRELMERELILE